MVMDAKDSLVYGMVDVKKLKAEEWAEERWWPWPSSASGSSGETAAPARC